MILLATNKRDITTDLIVLELRRRGHDFVRLNTEDVAVATVRFEPTGGWHYDIEDRTFALAEVTAGYYRRPEAPGAPAGVEDPAAAGYCTAEWSAVLRSLWNALEGRWLNSPFAILRAEDKPRQLAEARLAGLDFPETLVTNDPDAALAFTAEGATIGKPLRQALIERGETGEVLFTSRIDALGPEDSKAVALAPVILQREIAKSVDVRATLVGDRIFAAAIHSQEQAETRVDWRRGSRPDLVHEAIELPSALAGQLRALMHRLGLRFAAVDLVRDPDGRFWFLEINPNGQWAWIERRTGLPIAAAIVDALEARP